MKFNKFYFGAFVTFVAFCLFFFFFFGFGYTRAQVQNNPHTRQAYVYRTDGANALTDVEYTADYRGYNVNDYQDQSDLAKYNQNDYQQYDAAYNSEYEYVNNYATYHGNQVEYNADDYTARYYGNLRDANYDINYEYDIQNYSQYLIS